MVSPSRFGERYDDAIYVTAAKSLATGQGYNIISLPEPVPQTLIPPLYPFVLSLIWRAYPHFPDNLLWMMLFSVIAFLAFLALTLRYLVEQGYASGWQALTVIFVSGVNWRMAAMATSIVSEVLFALLSVATLSLAERYEKSQSGGILGAAVGVLAGLTFLTRTSGLILLVAIGLYLALRRQWKKALLPVAVGMLFVAAWFGWCYMHRTTGGGEHASYYSGYVRGIEATLGQLEALNQTSRLNVHLQIVFTNVVGIILVWLPLQSLGLRASMPMAGLIPIIVLFLALSIGGFVRAVRKRLRLLYVYLVLYLALHFVVPSHSYERYLTPIVPLLLLFSVIELSKLIPTLRRALAPGHQLLERCAAAFVALILVAAAAIAFYSNASGTYLSLTRRTPDAVAVAAETDTFEWIKANTNAFDTVVCFADPKLYLFTGRKAVRSVTVNIIDLVVYQERAPDPKSLRDVFLNIVDESQGRFLIVGATDFEYQAPGYGQSVESYLAEHPEQFVLVFQSAGVNNRIYRIQNRGGSASG